MQSSHQVDVAHFRDLYAESTCFSCLPIRQTAQKASTSDTLASLFHQPERDRALFESFLRSLARDMLLSKRWQHGWRHSQRRCLPLVRRQAIGSGVILDPDGYIRMASTGSGVIRWFTYRRTRPSTQVIAIVPATQHHDKEDALADFIDPHNVIGPLGVFVSDLDEKVRAEFSDLRIASGVAFVWHSPELNSYTSSLRAEDILHRVNQTPIESVRQLRSLLHTMKPGQAVVLQIEPRWDVAIYRIRPGDRHCFRVHILAKTPIDYVPRHLRQ